MRNLGLVRTRTMTRYEPKVGLPGDRSHTLKFPPKHVHDTASLGALARHHQAEETVRSPLCIAQCIEQKMLQ